MSIGGDPAPFVSIVLTTFNRAELLKRALASCLRQSYRNLEVIVVDDASADHTAAVVEDVRKTDDRVRYMRMPKNGGQSRALNAGFAATRGDLITWTSDDNRFKEPALAVMTESLQQLPDVDLVYADYEDVSLSGEVLRHCSPIRQKVDERFLMAGVCFLYRRRVYEEVGGYDERLQRCPDLDYWIRVQRRFAMRHLPVVLYENAVHPGMVSMAHAGSLYAEIGRVLARALPWPERPGTLARWYDQAASAEMKQGRSRTTIRYAWLAALLDARRLPEAVKRTYAFSPAFVRRAYRLLRRPFAWP